MTISNQNFFAKSFTAGTKSLVDSIASDRNIDRFKQIKNEGVKAAIFLETLLRLTPQQAKKADAFLNKTGFYQRFRETVELLKPNQKKKINDLVLLLPNTSTIKRALQQNQGFTVLDEQESEEESGIELVKSIQNAKRKRKQATNSATSAPSSSEPPASTKTEKDNDFPVLSTDNADEEAAAPSSVSTPDSSSQAPGTTPLLSIAEMVEASAHWATASTANEASLNLPAIRPQAAQRASVSTPPLQLSQPAVAIHPLCPFVPTLADPSEDPVELFNEFLNNVSHWDDPFKDPPLKVEDLFSMTKKRRELLEKMGNEQSQAPNRPFQDAPLKKTFLEPKNVFFMTQEGFKLWEKMGKMANEQSQTLDNTFNSASQDLSEILKKANENDQAFLSDYKTLFVLSAFYLKKYRQNLPISNYIHVPPSIIKRLELFRETPQQTQTRQTVVPNRIKFPRLCRLDSKLINVINAMIKTQSYDSDNYYTPSPGAHVTCENFFPNGAAGSAGEFLREILFRNFGT